ncbi:MAG: glycoside hydrolase family 3 N-terminal domain-containing protein, partial [Pseudomonadales bacterium]
MTEGATHLDPEQPLEQRVASILDALTIDEKLSLCAGQNFWQTRAIPRLGIKPFKMTDGPRGVGFHSSWHHCTAFPTGIAQAASWDGELMARFGEAIALETKSVGAQTILGPAINITRTPLNGRTFEYLSEDPVLNSRLVVPMVKAVQGQGVAACIKHFAANNQEPPRLRIRRAFRALAFPSLSLPAFPSAFSHAASF